MDDITGFDVNGQDATVDLTSYPNHVVTAGAFITSPGDDYTVSIGAGINFSPPGTPAYPLTGVTI